MDVVCSFSEDFLTGVGRMIHQTCPAASVLASSKSTLRLYALRRAGQRIKLEKIPMEVMVHLVEKAGILVNRTEIQAALWASDVFVDQDAAINTAIRKIRRALADEADHPRFVETVVGKGYRFIASLKSHDANVCPKDSRVDGGGVSSDRLRHHLPNYLVTRGKRQFVLDRDENLLGRDPEATRLHRPSVRISTSRADLNPLGTGSPRGSREPERNISRRTTHQNAH